MSMYGFIYRTTNLINGRQYIGQHKYCGKIDKYYLGSGVALNNAIKKYGRENFKREIICTCGTLEELNQKEMYYIKLYNAVNNKNFYNLAVGGNGGRGNNWYKTATAEQIQRANCARSKKMGGENNPFYGKKHSLETRRLLSNLASQKVGDKNPFYGKHLSEEHKLKMNTALGDICGKNNPFYGKQHTEATKQVIRNKMLERINSPNYVHPNADMIILENVSSGEKIEFLDIARCFKYLQDHNLNERTTRLGCNKFKYNTFRTFVQKRILFNNMIAYRK